MQSNTCWLLELAISPAQVSSGNDKINDRGRASSAADETFLAPTGTCDTCRWTPITANDESSSAAACCRNCTDEFCATSAEQGAVARCRDFGEGLENILLLSESSKPWSGRPAVKQQNMTATNYNKEWDYIDNKLPRMAARLTVLLEPVTSKPS